MKKNQTVQGTFSKLFGKKHANPPNTSLYATNPPWIFTQEAPEEGSRDFGRSTRAGWRSPGPGGSGGERGRRGSARPGRNTRRPAPRVRRRCREGKAAGLAVPGKGRGARGTGREGGPPPLAAYPGCSSEVIIFSPSVKSASELLSSESLPGLCSPQLRPRGCPFSSWPGS